MQNIHFKFGIIFQEVYKFIFLNKILIRIINFFIQIHKNRN